MHKPTTLSRLGGLLGAALSAVGDKAKLPESATFGPNPTLPTPRKERIPTVHIARAKGWPEGATPKAAPGFQVNAYAAGFDHCRWLLCATQWRRAGRRNRPALRPAEKPPRFGYEGG